MKKLLRKISAFLLALCLVSLNLSVVSAQEPDTIDNTPPEALSVTAEAQATAGYVMGNVNLNSISDTSAFYNASKSLLLAMRSGIDCSTYKTSYFAAVNSLLNSDGTLNITV